MFGSERHVLSTKAASEPARYQFTRYAQDALRELEAPRRREHMKPEDLQEVCFAGSFSISGNEQAPLLSIDTSLTGEDTSLTGEDTTLTVESHTPITREFVTRLLRAGEQLFIAPWSHPDRFCHELALSEGGKIVLLPSKQTWSLGQYVSENIPFSIYMETGRAKALVTRLSQEGFIHYELGGEESSSATETEPASMSFGDAIKHAHVQTPQTLNLKSAFLSWLKRFFD